LRFFNVATWHEAKAEGGEVDRIDVNCWICWTISGLFALWI